MNWAENERSFSSWLRALEVYIMNKYSIPFCSISWELYLKISSLVEFDTSLKSMWDFDFNLPQFRPYFVEHNSNYYLFLHAHYINKALKELGYEPLDDNWKRYNCVVRMSQEEPFIRQFSPSYVKSLVKKQLHLHHFTDKMIDDRLDKFTVENGRKQLHSSWAIPRNVIVRFDNCVYYDINKDHFYVKKNNPGAWLRSRKLSYYECKLILSIICIRTVFSVIMLILKYLWGRLNIRIYSLTSCRHFSYFIKYY